MGALYTIIVAVLVFGLIIFIHELGHFLSARFVGIKVHEFALGMGPAILKRIKGDTTYALRLFPIGGYVAMEGEDSESEDKDAFCNKTIPQRLLVIVAGATMNLLLGFLITVLILSMQPRLKSTVVSRFAETAVSSQKLQVDDRIVRVNGARVNNDMDIQFAFMRDSDGLVDMVVERAGEKVALSQVPFQMRSFNDGMSALVIDFAVYGRDKTIPAVLSGAFYQTLSIVKLVWVSLLDIFTGQFQLNQLSGPVGVATAIGEASAISLDSLLFMVSLITLNIGVFNLLPLPALDGGRVIFLLIEAVRGRPINAKYEGYIHTAGLILLLGVMVLVTFNDITNIIKG